MKNIMYKISQKCKALRFYYCCALYWLYTGDFSIIRTFFLMYKYSLEDKNWIWY